MPTSGEAKNIWWLYQARRVNTQGAAGPAALITRLQLAAGQVAKILVFGVTGTASAGSTLSIVRADEDNAVAANYGYAVAGANNNIQIPSVGSNANATGNLSSSVDALLGPGEIMRATASVSLATETLTVHVVLLLSTPVEPIWDTAGSGGTPSLAASTISAENTMQAVSM